MNILDFIFPKHCVSCRKFGTYLCPSCFGKIQFVENLVCPVCERAAFGGKTHPGCLGKYTLDGLVVACRYSGPAKAAILAVKYKWIYDVERVFVDLLAERFWKFDLPKNVVLVPVPLHKARKAWRGFNQSEILAKSLAKKFGVKFADILVRNRQTRSQVGLGRADRKENVGGAFSLNPSGHPEPELSHSEPARETIEARSLYERLDSGSRLKNTNIILVDDVFTSGATMGECCKVLKKAGAKNVWALAVALG